MIEIGILKNFDSGTYKAGVQLAGSLTTYFDDVSVAKNIPSSALVVGNYVILAIPGGNPKDACVIATWPQGSPGGGAGTFLQLTDTPSSYSGQGEKYVKVNTAADALEFNQGLHAATHKWQQADVLDLVQLLNQTKHAIIDFQTIDRWTQENTGSASQAVDIFACDLLTGTTSGSISRIRNTGNYIVVQRSSIGCHRYSLRNFGITQTASEIWLAIFRAVTAPADNAQHIGFKIVNGRIYASSCDVSGNYLQTDTGNTAMNTDSWNNKRLTVMWDGGDTAKFYIDTTLVATHTTCLPQSAEGRIILQIKNTSALNQRVRFMCLAYTGEVHWG